MTTNHPGNPYIAGRPLRGERGFFGRQNVLNKVKEELCNQDTNALVLFGQKRIGKSTILHQLLRTLPTDTFFPIYFDLHDHVERSLGQTLADLADAVADTANMELPDPNDFDDRGRFFHRFFLPNLYQAIGESRRPVFLLDEFDALDQAAKTKLSETATARAFLPFLKRVMLPNTPGPVFVLTVGRQMRDFSSDFTAIFKETHQLEIEALDETSAKALALQARDNGTLRFTERAITRILSITGCHPYFTQLLCQQIWEQTRTKNPTQPPLIDTTEVDVTVPKALEAGDQSLVWLWNGLDPVEQIYAAALAEIADEGMTIPKAHVKHILTTHAAQLCTDGLEMTPHDLVKRRVLKEAVAQEYCFAIDFFHRWVRLHKPPSILLVHMLVTYARERAEAGEENGALAACEQALRLSPDQWEAQKIWSNIWRQRGDAALKRGDSEAAQEAYHKADNVEIEPAHPFPSIPETTTRTPTQGKKQMSTITWLHLSDFHFRESEAYDSNIVLESMLDDIEQYSNDKQVHPDFIVISGDIAFASHPDEYASARKFLDKLRGKATRSGRLPKNRLFLVPGNHDVDRKKISSFAANVSSILDNLDAVNNFLVNDNERALVLQRFHNYQDFVNNYFGKNGLSFDNEHYFYSKYFAVANRRVAIYGLNSAWLSASDEDRNQLLLGEYQVRKALKKIKSADLHLAVMHHPFDWLQDFDQESVEPLLHKGCDFVLHGHLHQTGLLQTYTPDSEVMIIAAGACYEKRKEHNSYNFIQLDLDKGTGTIHLRMYSDRRGGFWTRDGVSYRNVDNGVYTFSLPKRLCQSLSITNAETATRVPTDKEQVEINDRSPTPPTSEALGTSPSTQATQLQHILVTRLSLEEFRTLCFGLEVSYDFLGGEGLAGKARELLLYLQRHDDLPRLIKRLRQTRPDIKM